jgi:molybdate transport system substrate-binding protein
VGVQEIAKQLARQAAPRALITASQFTMRKDMRICRVLGIALPFVLATTIAQAAEFKLVSSNAVKSSLEELIPQFEKASGHKVVAKWGTAAGLKVEIEKGEVFDVSILTNGGIDDLIRQGKLAGATRTALVRSAIGVAVRKGAPKPDISTTDTYKKALLSAKSITYVDQGASGIYLKELFARIGIADAIKSKVKLAPTMAADFIARGEAEIGMTQISEILPVAGADLVGPLPAEYQNYTDFASAVSSVAKQGEAARAFLQFLKTPEAAKVMKANGLEPQG